jgi:Methane oxygenase PmoA
MTRMNRTRQAPVLFLAVMAGVAILSRAADPEDGVKITRLDDRLRIEINGELFSEYHFKDVPRPFLYPIIGPDGLAMTRDWPMKEASNEDRDHKHHRSLWYAHGEINGVDFWGEEPRTGKTVHEEFTEIKSGRDLGIIRSKNKYVAPDGNIICTDERALRIERRPSERLFDFEITIHASNGDLVFGDTKEGTMAIRLNESMRLAPNKFNQGKPTGHIVNSEGVRDGATWGKRAAWCDYYGPVNGRIAGVAIFDHPQNPRHPTWWHVRDYGLFAANPFGLHDFEKKPAHAGDLKVSAGQSVTFRYRFYIHRGDDKEAKVAEHYQEYAKQ